MNKVEIDPNTLDHTERYKLLTGGIVPRPIAWVTTLGETGVVNAAPYSFFNGASVTPMMLMIGPANTAEGTDKDTMRNIERSGEFVVNIVHEQYARHAAATGEDVEPDISELDLVGLGSTSSRVVATPRIEGSPVAFECVDAQVIRFNGHVPKAGNVVFGRVVSVYVDDEIVDDRYRIDPDGLAAVGRMAGLTYLSTRRRVEIPKGNAALSTEQPDF